jgi:hypothetical protein
MIRPDDLDPAGHASLDAIMASSHELAVIPGRVRRDHDRPTWP